MNHHHFYLKLMIKILYRSLDDIFSVGVFITIYQFFGSGSSFPYQNVGKFHRIRLLSFLEVQRSQKTVHASFVHFW
jgi:hypothetical protein